jgi:hypothetical protein
MLALILALIATGATDVAAQKWEITPFLGYRWGGKLNDGVYEERVAGSDDLQFSSGVDYGLTLGYFVKPKIQIQAYWDRQNSSFGIVNDRLGIDTTLTDCTIDYYQVGFMMLPLDPEIRLQLFFSFSVGATYISPSDSRYEAEWFSSLGFTLGVRYFFTDHVGGLIQTRGMSTVMTEQDHLFCDELTQQCYGLPKDTYMGQINLSMGVVFAF